MTQEGQWKNLRPGRRAPQARSAVVNVPPGVRRANLINHAISLGWKKKLNGRDTVDVPGHEAKKIRWDYCYRGLYLGYMDDEGTGIGTFFRDLALTEEYGRAQLTDEEVQILALLAMREYPEIIAEW